MAIEIAAAFEAAAARPAGATTAGSAARSNRELAAANCRRDRLRTAPGRFTRRANHVKLS
jgi:hypothetical protein